MSGDLREFNSGDFHAVSELDGFEIMKVKPDQSGKQTFAVVLRPAPKAADSSLVAHKADRYAWLRFARHILSTLDPTPEDQILDSLRRIERLLEQRQQ